MNPALILCLALLSLSSMADSHMLKARNPQVVSINAHLEGKESYQIKFKLCEGDDAIDCSKDTLLTLVVEERYPSDGSYHDLLYLKLMAKGLKYSSPVLKITAYPKYYPFQRARWTVIPLKELGSDKEIFRKLFKEEGGISVSFGPIK